MKTIFIGPFFLILSFIFANIWFWGNNQFFGYCAAFALLMAEVINKNLTKKIVDKSSNS